jgi:hypothetical protein
MNAQVQMTGDLTGLPRLAQQYLKRLVLDTHAPQKNFTALPESVQTRAQARAVLVKALDDQAHGGASLNRRIQQLLAQLNSGQIADLPLRQAAQLLAQSAAGQKAPSQARLYDWHKRYHAMGLMGLVDGYKGRQRQMYGWEVKALRYWLQPQRPKAAIIAGWLQEDGYSNATPSRLQSWVKTLPASLGKEAPQRQGQHHYQQNHTPYVIRDNDV